MFALIFHACVGRSGSIEGLLVRDSQTSESLYYVLEQDTETGINRRMRNRPDPTGIKILKLTDILPAAYYWIHPGRPIPTRPKNC